MPWAVEHTLKMKYGVRELSISMPASALAGSWSLASVPVNTPKDPRTLLCDALLQLRSSGFEAALRGKRLGLLLADGTRSWDPELLLGALAEALAAASHVDAFLCTGTHEDRKSVV